MWTSINPKDGTMVGTTPRMTKEQMASRLSDAVGASFQWRDSRVGDRAKLLARCAARLDAGKHPLARLISDEMGKPILQSIAEIEKSVLCLEFYASVLARALKPEVVDLGKSRAQVRLEPLGPVLGIMPWNFPVWQTVRALAPALGLGNQFLCKPAPNTMLSALALEKILHDAGVPRGVYQTLPIEVGLVPDLIADPRVAAVTLTGSERAGRAVAALAGAALKKSVLELGGSDAYLVLSDAKMDRAVASIMESKLVNGGQSCVSVKRVIVEKKAAKELIKKLTARFTGIRSGDPLDPKTALGPMAREDLRDQLDAQVRASVTAGAKLAVGGKKAGAAGFYYEPTLLTDVRPGMRAFDEEVFGPVLAVIVADDVEHAIDLANRSRYGLGGAVFSASKSKREHVTRELACGMVGLNTSVRSDPRVPFGGVKCSGYGRELGAAGLMEFANIKTVFA